MLRAISPAELRPCLSKPCARLRHAPPFLAAALHQARAGGVSGVRRFTAEGAEPKGRKSYFC